MAKEAKSKGKRRVSPKGVRSLVWAVPVFLCLSSYSLVMLRWVPSGSESRGMEYIVGALFWLLMLAGYACAGLLRQRVRAAMRGGIPGAFRFFSNRFAAAADIMAAAALAGAVAASLLAAAALIQFAAIATAIFGIHMHCYFNGRVFEAAMRIVGEVEK